MENLEIVGWVLAVFAFLNATSTLLNFVSEKTKTKADDKIAGYFAKGLGYASKLIDLFIAKKK